MIDKLYAIAHKQNRLILGLMSGTSLDGLDLALCQIEGTGKNTILKLLHFITYPYIDSFRQDIQSIFAKPEVNMAKLSAMHVCIADVHAKMVQQALSTWQIRAEDVDILASHGQTVYHAPQSLTGNPNYPNSTLQLGDGDHLAVKTGIITISDFRQKHLAAGGEGAPLVVYGDNLLFAHEMENRILLNIGGIANFTFLPAGYRKDQPMATDVGPGNTLMNQYMQMYFHQPYDENGHTAAKGKINVPLLDALQSHPFFEQPFPKTTGPELFNLTYLNEAQQRSATSKLAPEDVIATITAFTAHAISQAIAKLTGPATTYQLYVSGGGYHNGFLMEQLRQLLIGVPIHPLDSLGINPDAKEAAIFALLANETVAGKGIDMQGGPGAPSVCLGKISLPG